MRCPVPLGRLLLAMAASFGWCTSAMALERADLEAAIVFNILSFVDWPADAAPSADSGVVICVDPASPLFGPLKSLEGRAIRSLKLSLRAVGSRSAARGCHALFVEGPSGAGSAAPAGGSGALLVITDEPGLAADGAAIRLDTQSGRVVFDVDLRAARDARLQISSRLLRLARKVAE